MIILYSSILAFNILAFKTVKGFSGNKILHLVMFTCAFQLIFDVFIDLKYEGYWYGTKGIDWGVLPAYFILIPPVNMIFLNWFPFNKSLVKKVVYIGIWEVFLLSYEYITLLPEPWGYFHYGWWTLWHSALINPFLLLILVGFYKLIDRLEERVIVNRGMVEKNRYK